MKLLKLKEWLTVPEAARHLSILFGEVVGEADVLRLAHLTLSVFFVNHVKARCGPIIPLKDTKRHKLKMLDGEALDYIQGLRINEEEVLGSRRARARARARARERRDFTGVWDLPMLGAERLDVENWYQMLTGGPSVELVPRACISSVPFRFPPSALKAILQGESLFRGQTTTPTSTIHGCSSMMLGTNHFAPRPGHRARTSPDQAIHRDRGTPAAPQATDQERFRRSRENQRADDRRLESAYAFPGAL